MEKFKSGLSCASLIITALYGAVNLYAVLLYNIYYLFGLEKFLDEINEFVVFVLGIGVFTWHIFVAFAVGTLIFKIHFYNNKEEKSSYYRFLKNDIIIHVIFTVLSFISIYFLFDKGF